MAYGAYIQNNNGEILIDGDFQNFMQSKSGTIGTGSQYDDGDSYYVKKKTISHPGAPQPPLVACQCDHYIGYHRENDKVSGEYTSFDIFQEAGGSPMNYVVHDLAGGDGDSGNWGMKVWKGNSDKVYDSREVYLKVEDVVTINSTLGYYYLPGEYPFPTPAIIAEQTPQTVTHNSVSNPYYILNNLRATFFGGAFPYTKVIKNVNNTSCKLTWLRTESFGFRAYEKWDPSPATLVVCSLVGG